MKRFQGIILLGLVLCFFSCKKEVEPVDPIVPVILEDGPLLTGSVVDTDGAPVAHAIVTDGFTHSETDEEGHFSFTSPYPERVRFVSVRIPSDYSPLVKGGRPVFYAEVPSYSGKERRARITLEKRSSPSDAFTMLVTADPQASTAQTAMAYTSSDIWEDLFADLRQKVSEVTGPCYGMCLGDIASWGENARPGSYTVYPQYCIGLESINIPFFQVIGNHDHMVGGSEDDDDSAYWFESAFGPRNYSFDLGKVHFLVVDNCMFIKDYRRYPFVYGLEDEFLEWLKGDLALVPKDMPVMVCTHANVFTKDGVQDWIYDGLPGTYKLDEFLEALQGFDKLYVWAGHAHNGHFIGKVESPANPSGIETFVVARSTGPSTSNEYVSGEGTPRGYVVMEVEGKDIRWHYRALQGGQAPFRGVLKPRYRWRPTDFDESFQINAYPRGSYGDDFVYANIFLWDPSWQTPVLKIGGETYPMRRDCNYDLGYKELVRHYKPYGWDVNYMGQTNREHSFYVRVPDNASGSATVEVTDRFGRTWSQEVSVDPVSPSGSVRRLVFDFRTAPSGLPTEVADNISFSAASGATSYTFSLSSGGYVPSTEAEEGYVLMNGVGCTLAFPALPGYKLTEVTVHPSDNSFRTQRAQIQTSSGGTVTGGDLLPFCGNTTDNWILEETLEGAGYRLRSTVDAFHIGELRLSYRSISDMQNDGNADDFTKDDPVEF